MVYGLKYRNIRAAAPHNGGSGSEAITSQSFWRGEVSKGVCIPLETRTLLRTENTPPQVSMSGIEERRRNIEGAFECAMGMAGRNVLLVDDVVTTGSTMFACAAALKTAGAVSVWGPGPGKAGLSTTN